MLPGVFIIYSSAPGRIGIVGNPSDIYGGKMIAMTIQYRASVWLIHAKTLSVKHYSSKCETDQGLFKLVKASLDRLESEGWINEEIPMEVYIETDIPKEAGVGGSTAIIVAYLDACRKMLGLSYDNYRLAEMAQKIEHKELGIVSGYNDRYSITFGGLTFMDFTGKNVDREVWEGEPYGKIRLVANVDLPLVCGYWGVRRSSGLVHAPIRKRFLEGDVEVTNAVKEIIAITEEGEKAVVQSDWKKLGELMNRNYEITREVGWAYRIDGELRKIGLRHGAKAAKLGGAGNGGVMVFLCPKNKVKVIKALEDAGAKTFIPKISSGLR